MSKFAAAFAALAFSRSLASLRMPLERPGGFNELLDLDDRLLDDIGLSRERVREMMHGERHRMRRKGR